MKRGRDSDDEQGDDGTAEAENTAADDVLDIQDNIIDEIADEVIGDAYAETLPPPQERQHEGEIGETAEATGGSQVDDDDIALSATAKKKVKKSKKPKAASDDAENLDISAGLFDADTTNDSTEPVKVSQASSSSVATGSNADPDPDPAPATKKPARPRPKKKAKPVTFLLQDADRNDDVPLSATRDDDWFAHAGDNLISDMGLDTGGTEAGGPEHHADGGNSDEPSDEEEEEEEEADDYYEEENEREANQELVGVDDDEEDGDDGENDEDEEEENADAGADEEMQDGEGMENEYPDGEYDEDEEDDTDGKEDEEEGVEGNDESQDQDVATLDDEVSLHQLRELEYGEVSKFTEEQMRRYEAYRRSDLKKPKVKKILMTINPMLAMMQPSDPFIIAIKALGKMFVGDMVETARAIQKQRGERGALKPKHLREAYRLLGPQLPTKRREFGWS